MVECVRCSASEIEVRLFDAVYDFRMESICERCSIIENIPLIKKPSSEQIKNSEIGVVSVKRRLDRISDLDNKKKEDTFFIEDRLKELDGRPELERPQGDQLNLIDHFHWHIQKNRRRKGMTEIKLADALGESEEDIIMIEKAKIPENAESLIRKLEQFFQVKLRKIEEIEKKDVPVLLDKMGRELGSIPEPEIISSDEIENKGADGEDKRRIDSNRDSPRNEIEEVMFNKKEEEENKDELKNIDLKEGVDIKGIREKFTIADLKKLHEKKMIVNRQEKLEEQRRIEERNRLIEAKKEELMMRKEKESRDIDRHLGGSELLKGEKSKSADMIKEFDEELK